MEKDTWLYVKFLRKNMLHQIKINVYLNINIYGKDIQIWDIYFVLYN